MIAPFEPEQVKMRGDQRLVSYGTSSYGYDIRCSNEFKIFTNINSAIVDPKNFDANSFVDFRGDVCIIPPNSFALARTVEYFRIPRNVLTICLGKCVTGDTKVMDADTGDYLPIAEWTTARRTAALGPEGWRKARVAAMARHGVKPVWRLETESGHRLTATAHHPLLTPQGWRPLKDLAVGDVLASASEIGFFGTVPLVAPERLGRWFRDQVVAGQALNVPKDVFRARKVDLKRFIQSVFGECPGEGLLGPRAVIEDLRHLASRLGIECMLRAEAGGSRLVLGEVAAHAALWGQANGTDATLPGRAPYAWDPIVALSAHGEAAVYDLEVPGLHNFLANGLVIHNSTYARCGIIVNVTPFEPEWEGHVTLEFSNTSPLPAKIYANEGVAQVIFFEADEPCETSYKDRGGKYQGQQGVTLPKT